MVPPSKKKQRIIVKNSDLLTRNTYISKSTCCSLRCFSRSPGTSADSEFCIWDSSANNFCGTFLNNPVWVTAFYCTSKSQPQHLLWLARLRQFPGRFYYLQPSLGCKCGQKRYPIAKRDQHPNFFGKTQKIKTKTLPTDLWIRSGPSDSFFKAHEHLRVQLYVKQLDNFNL